MMKEINKRMLTGIFLFALLLLSFVYSFILIISLIFLSAISWIEFNGLISKIFTKNIIKVNFLRFITKSLSLIYLVLFSYLIFEGFVHSDFSIIILYFFLICIFSDIGGYIFGKTFKGKKLTKISPNKTISGSFGSFLFSLIPYILLILFQEVTEVNFYTLFFITIILSFVCQVGDLFISYFKRKSKIKDTGTLLPGHGGLLDRIDGIIFAVPAAFILDKILF